jgi:hypothetical protein
MFLRWLVPALTGILFVEFASESSGFLHGAGLVFGCFYLWAAISESWNQYVRTNY